MQKPIIFLSLKKYMFTKRLVSWLEGRELFRTRKENKNKKYMRKHSNNIKYCYKKIEKIKFNIK